MPQQYTALFPCRMSLTDDIDPADHLNDRLTAAGYQVRRTLTITGMRLLIVSVPERGAKRFVKRNHAHLTERFGMQLEEA